MFRTAVDAGSGVHRDADARSRRCRAVARRSEAPRRPRRAAVGRRRLRCRDGERIQEGDGAVAALCRRRPSGRSRPWRRGDRRDHLLHQHLESERADRRRPARAQRRGEGLEGEAVGEDLACAGQPGGRGVSRQLRPAEGSRQGRLQPRSASAAPPASAIPVRCRRRFRSRSTTTASSPPRCCRATATSKAASARTCRRTISPRRRWSSPMRSRAPCARTSPSSRSATARTASRCT